MGHGLPGMGRQTGDTGWPLNDMAGAHSVTEFADRGATKLSAQGDHMIWCAGALALTLPRVGQGASRGQQGDSKGTARGHPWAVGRVCWELTCFQVAKRVTVPVCKTGAASPGALASSCCLSCCAKVNSWAGFRVACTPDTTTAPGAALRTWSAARVTSLSSQCEISVTPSYSRPPAGRQAGRQVPK